MVTYLNEQELNEFKEGKASVAVTDKLKALTEINFVPQTVINQSSKEKETIKAELEVMKIEKVTLENKFKEDLQKQIDEVTKIKSQLDSKEKIENELRTQLDSKQKEFDEVKKSSDAFDNYKSEQVENAKKLLGDKWIDEFANLDLIKLAKVVTEMTGKTIAAVFTPPGSQTGQDSVISGKERIARGLQEKLK